MKNQIIGAGIVLAIFSTALIVNNTKAQETVGFTISPPTFELKANPGDKLEEVIDLYNASDSDYGLVVSTQNLKPMGDVGQVEFSDDNSLPSLKDWLNYTSQNINLPSKQKQVFKYSINIPQNASPGGYFISIFFSLSSDQGNGAIIANKVGSIIALTVAGDIKEDGEIISFQPTKKIFWDNGKIDFEFKVRNAGNVYIKPRGFLVVNNALGKKIHQVEAGGKNVLPNAERVITSEFESQRYFGPYGAILSLNYGSSGKNLNASTGFYVIPWKLTLTVGLILLAILIARKRLWGAFKVLLGKEK